MEWVNLVLITCIIVYTFHISVLIHRIDESYKNWAQSVVDECNRQLNESVIGYKAKVSDWLTDYIDNLMSSMNEKVKDSDFESEK